MTAPRDEKGRFVRADQQPVLHRQVDPATAEWLQLTAPKDPHGPRISLGILVCTVLAIALGVAIIAWLLGVWL